LSVAIAWPGGAVAIPPLRYTATSRPPRRIAGLAMPPLAAWLGTLIGIAILAAAWARVGRDPKGGAIYPRFEPPAGLSPAAARFIRQQGFDDGCLTAAILSMAVKGALTIRETGKGLLGRATYALQPQGRTGRRLSRGEVAAYLALFAEDDAPLDLKPDKKNGTRVDRARAALQKALRDEHVDATFRAQRPGTGLRPLEAHVQSSIQFHRCSPFFAYREDYPLRA
jgi:hypothetical protein